MIVPAALGFIVLAGPITSLLLEHGAAGAADARLIARTLQGFAVGLPFFSAFQLITRTFYAAQDSRTPALINVGAAAVTVGVDVVLVVVAGWDVPGLALGHAASYVVATGAGIVLLRVKLGSIDGARVTRTLVRTLAAAVTTALAAWLVATGVAAVIDTQPTIGRLVQVSIAVVAGALTYLAAALMFGLQEVDEVVGAVRRRFRG